MRRVRLLYAVTSIVTVSILLYLGFGAIREDVTRAHTVSPKKSKIKPLFSFTSPGSLFPPSAIISLTDDNSTFFLARPAAFGPLLPEKGLSGPLWIGGGFSEDIMGRGELGCSDVPGWTDEASSATISSSDSKSTTVKSGYQSGEHRTKRSQSGEVSHHSDGTDDHLRPANIDWPSSRAPAHADIQSLQEGAEIAGKVVLLKRGGCGFLDKVKWAQARGGVALIVGDNVRGEALVRMYAHGDTSNVSIPAIFTSHTTAHLLSSLLPSGARFGRLSPQDEAKLKRIRSGKRGKSSRVKTKSRTKHGGGLPATARTRLGATQTSKSGNVISRSHETEARPVDSDKGWLLSTLSSLGIGNGDHHISTSGRPSSSGVFNWAFGSDPLPSQTPIGTTRPSKSTSTATPGAVDFIIGEQDWRDPDLLPTPTSASSSPKKTDGGKKDGSVITSSDGYSTEGETAPTKQKSKETSEEQEGWLSGWFADDDEPSIPETALESDNSDSPTYSLHSGGHNKDNDDTPHDPEEHEGLWVTLSPTNMSSSPFFDTLLVLVVSPLVTLTVVYALLLLRSRLRRRRWRAPKSVVDSLPVRTYHTISESTSSISATPATSSPTTPLLQHSQARTNSNSNQSRPRSRTTSEVPATSSSFQPNTAAPGATEEEKREAGLAEWRRRYGGRQKECVICLDEYVDGVSKVMSLPCGHEFHAECMYVYISQFPAHLSKDKVMLMQWGLQYTMASYKTPHMSHLQRRRRPLALTFLSQPKSSRHVS
jgi:hypothetical protein